MPDLLAKLAPFQPYFPRSEHRQPPQDAALSELESGLRSPLPPGFAAFLRECAGVALHGARVRGEDGIVVHPEVFYGFGDDDYGYDLLGNRKTYADRLPPDALPFADDAGGNQLFLMLRGPDLGHVMFWNHDAPRPDDALPPWVLERVEESLRTPAARELLTDVDLDAKIERERTLLRWNVARDVLPWWECIYRVADSFGAFFDALEEVPSPKYPSGRVGAILRALDEGADREWTAVGDREALRITYPDGSRQVSMLTDEERAKVEPALTSPRADQ